MLTKTKRNNANILFFNGDKCKPVSTHELGFSLVEIMVGLIIGMLVTLVIMQVFSVFEGQKRSTTGTADAQTNGNIALYNIQRDVQMAGFGLPEIDPKGSPMQCSPSPSYDDPDTPFVEDFDMFPITIVDGGTGSDQITVRYGDAPMGGISTLITSNPAGLPEIVVDNNMGCKVNNVAMIVNQGVCAMTKIRTVTATTKVTVAVDGGGKVASATKSGASLFCLGNWSAVGYGVNNNMLERNGQASVAEVVNIQAQYGISDVANNNKVTSWVDASGIWAAGTLSVANRNRIKAVRVAVVARNGQLEKESVTLNAPVAWPDEAGSPAPAINLTTIADWQRYRYRVYETIIPVRNIIWSKNVL